MTSFRMSKYVKEYSDSLTTQAAKARYLTISSIINSWNYVPMELLQKSFKGSGIFPCDPSVLLNNPNTNHSEKEIEKKKQNKIEMSSQLLTSDVNILQLHNQEYGTAYSDINQIPKKNYSSMIGKFNNYCIYRGMIFSSFPKMLIELSSNIYEIKQIK